MRRFSRDGESGRFVLGLRLGLRQSGSRFAAAIERPEAKASGYLEAAFAVFFDSAQNRLRSRAIKQNNLPSGLTASSRDFDRSDCFFERFLDGGLVCTEAC